MSNVDHLMVHWAWTHLSKLEGNDLELIPNGDSKVKIMRFRLLPGVIEPEWTIVGDMWVKRPDPESPFIDSEASADLSIRHASVYMVHHHASVLLGVLQMLPPTGEMEQRARALITARYMKYSDYLLKASMQQGPEAEAALVAVRLLREMMAVSD